MWYKLIRKSVNQLEQLEQEVNVLLELGWNCVGEIKQAQCDGATIFIQQLEYIKPPLNTNSLELVFNRETV